MAPYRPPGRSNRSGRSNADNDVFEGLPVKQWSQPYSRVSLAPPVPEVQPGQDDRWGEVPLPRDYQLLLPWTQYLLRLARSGKVGNKRKQDSDATGEDRHEDEANEESTTKPSNLDERGYVAKKWKHVPEHMLVQEHKHFEFLAKRRRGLPSLYAPDQLTGALVPMRKTKVQKTDSNGEIALYEVLVPEGQAVDGEVTDTTELPDVKPVVAAPGTVVEGVGIANDDGVLVAEHLKPSVSSRRNRPPPKKKGGPGRGKKRVTFTNPDGSTYTTIVPNATKIVPQPGQIVKHVAKGEEARADITAEEAAAASAVQQDEHSDEGSSSEEGDDDRDDDDDDREEGELSDDDTAPGTGAATPATSQVPAQGTTMHTRPDEVATPREDALLVEGPAAESREVESEAKHYVIGQPLINPVQTATGREASSSPDIPLASNTHSRTGSMVEPPPALLDTNMSDGNASNMEAPVEPESVLTDVMPAATTIAKPVHVAKAVSMEEDKIMSESPLASEARRVEESISTVKLGVATESEPPAEQASTAVPLPEAEDETVTEAPLAAEAEPTTGAEAETARFEDGDEDLLGNLEKYTQPES